MHPLSRRVSIVKHFILDLILSSAIFLTRGRVRALLVGFGEFENMHLEIRGLDATQATVSMCKRCHYALQYRKRRPQVAIANNLWFGKIPDELKELTWAEERLICLHRVHLDVVHFLATDTPGKLDSQHMQPKMKQHFFCVPQDTITTNTLLPPHPNDLPNYFQVSLQVLLVVSLFAAGVVFERE